MGENFALLGGEGIYHSSIMDNSNGFYTRFVGEIEWRRLDIVLDEIGVGDGEQFCLLSNGKAQVFTRAPPKGE